MGDLPHLSSPYTGHWLTSHTSFLSTGSSSLRYAYTVKSFDLVGNIGHVCEQLD